MARFIGRYEHSLDIKGRVILPAKLRASFDTQAFLTQQFDRCLALWTPEGFEQLSAAMEEKQLIEEERNSVRLWASTSVEVELDRLGRFAIPHFLREFAGLENGQPAMITGAIDHIELWKPQEFIDRVQPTVAKWTTTTPAGLTPSV